MPQGVDLKVVPAEVRQALAEVVQPVYERIVLRVDDPLEKSLGVTIAHLLWLEVLQQFDLKREYVQYSAVLGLSENRSALIEQHLRIIYSKVKVGYFLARLRELRQTWQERSAGGPSVPSLPSGGHAGLRTAPALDSSPAHPPALPEDRHPEGGYERPEDASG